MQNGAGKLVTEKIRGSDGNGRVEDAGAGREDLVGEYLSTLGGRSASTVNAYGRILRQRAAWVAEKPGGTSGFRPELLTRTAVEGFLSELEARGYGASHRSKAKSAISGFCVWLVEEKGLLRRNPTRGVEVPAMQVLAPRRLSPDQRYVLKNLVEKEGSARSAAIFALGNWAGCRVNDVSGDVTFHDLRHDFAHRAREAGWHLEEVAYYLGHVAKKGTPAIGTTARYTQVSREDVKEKLELLRS